MAKKTGISSPMVSLNNHDLAPAREIFEAELAAAQKSLNFAQKKVITIYSGHQEISLDEQDDTLSKGMNMIEKMTLKKTMKTVQPYLYYGASAVPSIFRNVKIGDKVVVPTSFTASANPLFALTKTVAQGSIIVIENARVIPVANIEADEMNYIFAAGAEFTLTKVEKQTVVYRSHVSKNLTVFTVTM